MYEIHITVSTNDISKFRKVCEKIGVKPIVLDLQDKLGNTVFQDVMTSSKYKNHNIEIEVRRIKEGLKDFEVVRTKIEVSPFYELVPNKANGLSMSYSQYFESHIRVITQVYNIAALRGLISNYAHVSRNIFKSLPDGNVQILLTIRDNRLKKYEDFLEKVKSVNRLLTAYSYVTDKVEVEYVLYDSNKSHDISWLTA